MDLFEDHCQSVLITLRRGVATEELIAQQAYCIGLCGGPVLWCVERNAVDKKTIQTLFFSWA